MLTTESSVTQDFIQNDNDIYTRPAPRKIYHRTNSRRLEVEKYE